MKIRSCGVQCEVAKTLYFSDTKNALKLTHPSEKRRLRPIPAYNVSTVRASKEVQLLRIGSRPRAFQRAIDEVRTLPLSPPKDGQKVNLSFV